MYSRPYTPLLDTMSPLEEEILLGISDQLQFLDRGFAAYFLWLVDSDAEYFRRELQDIRRHHADAQNRGPPVPGMRDADVVLGDLGDFCEQVIRIRAQVSPDAARSLRYEVTSATVRDRMCYIQDAHEAPYWKLMLAEFGRWHANAPGLEASGVMTVIQCTKLAVMADLARLRQVTTAAAPDDDHLVHIINGIQVRMGLLDAARDGSNAGGLRSLRDLLHKSTRSGDDAAAAEHPTPGTDAARPDTQPGSTSTIMSIVASLIFFALAVVPFAVGFDKASDDGGVGTPEDADFWFLASGNVMTTLGGVLVVVLSLLRGRRMAAVSVSVWLLLVLGGLCSVLSLVMYTRLHAGWSNMFVLFGSIAGVAVTLVLTLGENCREDAPREGKLKTD